jgi:hypothetical protein
MVKTRGGRRSEREREREGREGGMGTRRNKKRSGWRFAMNRRKQLK